MVDSVDYSQVQLALRVVPGYQVKTVAIRAVGSMTGVVQEVDVTTIPQLTDLLESCSPSSPVSLTFRRPDPDQPHRGWARKKLRVATSKGMTDGQKAWCESFVGRQEEVGCEPRARVVYSAMKAKFGVTTLDEDGVFCLASQQQIFDWLKARFKRKKAVARVVAGDAVLTVGGAAVDVDDAGGNDSEGAPDATRYDHLLVGTLHEEMTKRGLDITDGAGKKLLKQPLRDALLADDAAKETAAAKSSRGGQA